jgi:hypothetical protein
MYVRNIKELVLVILKFEKENKTLFFSILEYVIIIKIKVG